MSNQKLKDILERQRRVVGLLHNQKMAKREVAESLLLKQHDAELENFIHARSPSELATLLEELDTEDAKLLWKGIPADRANDVLWELPDALREAVAEGQEPVFEGARVSVYELVDGRLRQTPVQSRQDLEGRNPLWIDLVSATRQERAYIGSYYDVELPDPQDSTDLEVSARFYVEENDDIHLLSNFLRDSGGDSHSVPVAFLLHRGTLFTLRDEELPVFRLQRRRALTQPGYVSDGVDVLLDLYGADVEFSADCLEKIYETLGRVGKLVLSENVSDDQAAMTLASIAEEEDQNGRIRGNILDTQRAIAFLMRARVLSADQLQEAKQILRNVESLNNHTSFLFDKINFLMDATIGFININQNKRVNQLTVVSVVFMPINILAGIGGMSEFSMMTSGIRWPLAYGAFFCMAMLIGYGTFVWLKRAERRSQRAARAASRPS